MTADQARKALAEKQLPAQGPIAQVAFCLALINNKADLVNLYLTAGMPANGIDCKGNTPLEIAILAAYQTRNTESLSLLLDHGAKINQPDGLDNTPLNMAQQYEEIYGDQGITGYLKQRGAIAHSEAEKKAWQEAKMKPFADEMRADAARAKAQEAAREKQEQAKNLAILAENKRLADEQRRDEVKERALINENARQERLAAQTVPPRPDSDSAPHPNAQENSDTMPPGTDNVASSTPPENPLSNNQSAPAALDNQVASAPPIGQNATPAGPMGDTSKSADTLPSDQISCQTAEECDHDGAQEVASNHPELAIPFFRKQVAIAMNSGDQGERLIGYNNLAVAYFEQGNRQAALSWTQKTLQEDPQNKAALFNLQRIQQALNQ